MTKEHYTPGPWTHGFDGHGGICIETDDCDGLQIGFVSRGSEANARLVAAAPELLAALDMLHRYNQTDLAYHNTPAAAAAHAAIAKATGGQP